MHKHDYLEPYTSELRSSIKVNDSSLHLVLSERDECPKEMNRYMNGIDRKCYTMIPHDILSVHNSDAQHIFRNFSLVLHYSLLSIHLPQLKQIFRHINSHLGCFSPLRTWRNSLIEMWRASRKSSSLCRSTERAN